MPILLDGRSLAGAVAPLPMLIHNVSQAYSTCCIQLTMASSKAFLLALCAGAVILFPEHLSQNGYGSSALACCMCELLLLNRNNTAITFYN
jgi:hypothetical protein